MLDGFIDRENEIFGVLQKFNERGLEYIVVGGYAVSAFKHRFSVDADVVIRGKDLKKFRDMLTEEGFKEEDSRDIESVYGGKFVAFCKNKELPVTVDVLVDELRCRQTGASWSYSYLEKHSEEKVVEGSEREVGVRVPEPELLMAIKTHSARLTDCRDIVALMPADFRTLEEHMGRGDRNKLLESLEKVENTLSSEDFEDSFKGVFSEKELPEDAVDSVLGFLRQRQS